MPSHDLAVAVMPVETAVAATQRPDLGRALTALWHEDLETAEAALRVAIEVAPEHADAHALLGATLLATGRPEGAMLEIEEALRLDPTGFLAQMKAGELALRLGDPGTAAERFLGALRASVPGSREAQVATAARASAQRALGRSIEHRAALPKWIARLVGERRVPAPRGMGVIDVRE
ncbi:MAG: tetratricopeptide repeat protein [Candidatus Limnocylindrales bacterium]